MDANAVGRHDLPPTAVAMLELVARGFDVTQGQAIVELVFHDGMVQVVWLKQRLSLSRVREFDAVFGEAWRVSEALTSG